MFFKTQLACDVTIRIGISVVFGKMLYPFVTSWRFVVFEIVLLLNSNLNTLLTKQNEKIVCYYIVMYYFSKITYDKKNGSIRISKEHADDFYSCIVLKF